MVTFGVTGQGPNVSVTQIIAPSGAGVSIQETDIKESHSPLPAPPGPQWSWVRVAGSEAEFENDGTQTQYKVFNQQQNIWSTTATFIHSYEVDFEAKEL